MKRKNKGLLYFRTILSIFVLIFMLGGCKKVTILPNGEEMASSDAEKQDTTPPTLILAKSTLITEADTTLSFKDVCKELEIIATDITDVTFTLEIMDGPATVTVDKNIYLADEGESRYCVTATDEFGNVSKAEFSIIATEATYPVFDEALLEGVWLTVGDEEFNFTELITAIDKKDGNLPVMIDESGVDRKEEGKYVITASTIDSDGREASIEVPVDVVDMSYIDTEKKAMIFTMLLEQGEADEVENSLWSQELGNKYNIPGEHIKGGFSTEPPSIEQLPQETQLSVQEVEGYKDDWAQQMFAKVNEYRMQNGVQALSWEESLVDGSKTRASEIVESFSHTRPDGSMPNSLGANGENILSGYITPGEVEDSFNAWINSADHKETILDTDFHSTAISCYCINGKSYWVQLFKF